MQEEVYKVALRDILLSVVQCLLYKKFDNLSLTVGSEHIVQGAFVHETVYPWDVSSRGCIIQMICHTRDALSKNQWLGTHFHDILLLTIHKKRLARKTTIFVIEDCTP